MASPAANPTTESAITDKNPGGRRHFRRSVYRTRLAPRDDENGTGCAVPEPAPENFTAFNDFIHISRPLLGLSREPPDWLYPAEHIHVLLSNGRDRMRLMNEGFEQPDFFAPG